jgi:tetratricopeptide (TPR) repeat protein
MALYQRAVRAALHFVAGEPDAALALVGDDVGRPALALMQAQTLLKANPERAREILWGRAFFDAPAHQKLAAELLVVETFVQEGRSEQALEHAERLVRDYEWSVEPLTELAHVQRLLGKNDADQTLTRAVAKLNPDTRFLERFQVASALDDVGRYDEVVSVLEIFVDHAHDSPALQLLTFAYINADRRKAAFDLIKNLPDDLVSRPPYLRALAAVNANRKDFPAALDALDRYLAVRADDLEMWLHWASLCLRQGQKDRVTAFLKSDVEALVGPAEARMELAHWLDRFGFSERALKLAYSVFLDHSGSPQVHLRYIGLILQPARAAAVQLNTGSIDDNVAFEIDDSRGDNAWYVIEPESRLRKDETYIAPDHITRRAKDLWPGRKII